MVALEAMAMGTPVIASEVGGLAYVVRDGYNGFLVPRRDAEALAGRILSLLHDSTLRTRLSAQAQEYAPRLRLARHRRCHAAPVRRTRHAGDNVGVNPG
jgi:glycosyltransferase involved in cell wall biosynthesis